MHWLGHSLVQSTDCIDPLLTSIFLAEVDISQAKSLFTTLRDAFSVDEQVIREAVAHQRD